MDLDLPFEDTFSDKDYELFQKCMNLKLPDDDFYDDRSYDDEFYEHANAKYIEWFYSDGDMYTDEDYALINGDGLVEEQDEQEEEEGEVEGEKYDPTGEI
jgi:hypothetical protein